MVRDVQHALDDGFVNSLWRPHVFEASDSRILAVEVR